MALNPKEAQELAKLLREIETLSRSLGKNIDLSAFSDLEKSAYAIRATVKSLRNEFKSLNSDLDDLVDTFGDLVKKIKSAEEGSKKTIKVFDGFNDIARKIYDHQRGYNELSEDDADLLVTKLKNQKKRLEDLQKQLKLEEDHFEKKKKDNTLTQDALDEINDKIKENQKAQEKINDLLSDQNDEYSTLLSKAKSIRQQQENLQKAFGLSGAAIDGVGKAFNKIGLGSLADQLGLDKAKAKMKDTADRITDGGKKGAHLVTQFRVLGAGMGSLGKSIMKNLTDPLVLAGIAAKAVSTGVGLIKKGFSLLKGGISSVVGFVQKLWGMADQFAAVFEKYAKAGQFAAQNFSAMGAGIGKITSGLNAAAAADPFMRVAEAGPALKAIVDGVGIFKANMTKSTKEAHDFSYWLGYSADETGRLYRLSATNNKTMTDTSAEMRAQGYLLNKQHKTSLDLRKVEKVALSSSLATNATLKNNTKALFEASFYATKLGMTLDEMRASAAGVLDFESSISAQLEYQTLSGKELNLDALQQATAAHDTVGIAREMNKLVEEHGAGLLENKFIADSFGKALNVSGDKALEMYENIRLANQLGEDQADVEATIARMMKEQGISREEAAKRISKQDIANSLAASKRAEAMSRALEDFRDYMATRLWPLFRAVFSPANIKMFMTVISGMRPVFVELGKAITAFFSPKSAGAMTDVLKNDVMPAILDLAKMLTEVAGGAGETLYNIIKSIGPVIKTDVIPIVKYLGGIIKELAPTIGILVKSLAGGVVSILKKVNENKEEIKEFIVTIANKLKDVFDFISGHLKEIGMAVLALKGFSILKSSGVFELVKMAAGVARLGRGANPLSPLFVKDTSGMASGDKWKNLLSFGLAGNKGKGGASPTTAATSTVSTIKSTLGGAMERGSSPMNPLFVKDVSSIGGAGVAKDVAALKSANPGMTSSAALNQIRGGFGGGASAAGAAGSAGGAASNIAGAAGGASSVAVPNGADKAGSKLGQFGKTMGNAAGDLLKAAAAILIIAGALYVAAKAFQEFALVDWEDIGKGIVTLIALGGAVFLLSKFLDNGQVLVASAAMLIMAGALWVMGKAIQEFTNLELGDLALATGALLVLTGVMLGLGAVMMSGIGAAAFFSGVAALLAMGAALFVVAAGLDALIKVVGGGRLETLGTDLGKGLEDLTTGLKDVKFDELESVFEGIEDAFDELDVDDLLAFSELAGASLAGAARNLLNGIQELAKLDTNSETLKIDKGEFSSKLAAYFEQLEGVFDEVEDAIDELDIDNLIKFADLAGKSISSAVRSLYRGIEEMGKFKIEGKSSSEVIHTLAQVELIVDEFEDVLGELDFDQLENFSKMSSSGLVTAASVLKQGIETMQKELPGMVINEDQLKKVQESFIKLTKTFNVLRLDNITKFAELSKSGLEDAALKFKTAIETLGNMTFDVSEESTEKIKTAFKTLSETFTSSGLDNIIKFAELSKGDLVGAATNFKLGVEAFANLTFAAIAPDKQKAMTDAFAQFDAVIGTLSMDNILKFAELAKSSLANAATNFQSGVNSLNQIGASMKDADFSGIKNLQKPIEELQLAFGGADSKIFDFLNSFAKLELKDFDKKTTDFKNAITKINELGNSFYTMGPVQPGTEEANPFQGIQDMFEDLNDALGGGIASVTDFLSKDFSGLDKSVSGFIKGIKRLTSTDEKEGLGKPDMSVIKQFFTDLSTVFAGTNLEAFTAFAEGNFEKLPKNTSLLKQGMDSINAITVSDALAQLINLLPQFSSQLNSLGSFDSTKIITLSEAICKLYESLNKFNETLTNLKGNDISSLLSSITSLNSALANIKSTAGSQMQYGVPLMQDGVIQVQDSNLNPNGGLVISKYQKGQLQPVAQGIKEDNVYLTPNRPSSGGGSTTVTQDNSQVVAAIQALTAAITNSNKEVAINLNGQTVGKLIVPTIVEEVKKQAVNL